MPYQQPSPISPYPLKCYCIELPDAPEYERAFYGAMLTLTNWLYWQPDREKTAIQAARYMASVILPQFGDGFMCCCDNYNSSQLVNLANLQQAQRLVDMDTGSYLSFAPDAPDTSFSSDTHDTTPDLEQKRLNALCAAIQSYLVMELHYWTDLTNASAAALTAAVFLIPGVGWIVGIVMGAGIGLTAAKLTSILTDQDAIKRVVCSMYVGLLGQPITFDNFKAVLAGGYGVPGSNEHTLAQWLNDANQKTENYHAFVAYLGDAFIAASSSIDDACDCCYQAPLVFDWKNNIDATTGWTVGSPTDFDPATIFLDPLATYNFDYWDNGGGEHYIRSGGFLTDHLATVGVHDVDNGDCDLTGFKVDASPGTATATDSKLWVYRFGAWEAVAGAVLSWGSVTYEQKSVSFAPLSDVEKIAILNYSGNSFYMGRLELVFG